MITRYRWLLLPLSLLLLLVILCSLYTDAATIIRANQIQLSDVFAFTGNNTHTGTESFTKQITSSLATGTAPLSIASTTNVANLNASSLNGATMAVPGAIGGTTPNTGAFTTFSATGQITSTLATGTAPLVIASTTSVANLVASSHPQVSACTGIAFNGSCPAFSTVGNGKIIYGDVTLSGGTSTLNNLPFAGSSNYRCTGTDTTAANAVKIVHTSGSVITLTGTGTDVISVICIGS